MDSRIMFLFGAGAERFAGLPSGGEYTKQTMLTKNSNLYKELKKFYANSASKSEKIPQYEEAYMFRKNSHTLFEIVVRALSNYDTKSGEPYTENENLNRLLKIYSGYGALSEEEQLKLLATNGMLVKRPLVVNGDTVLIGFKEAEWAEKLN